MSIRQQKATALYCRLSRDDEFAGDSMSIQTQKTMLAQYAKSNNIFDYEYYIDDGYSGTNYNRPDFMRMLEDIENGKIGTVVVKDLSRLGREYLQTGYYTEIYFPNKDIRFIAINDNVDSNKGENDFAPFKNIINEWYARDSSQKVRSALRAKAKNGEYTGSRPAFGYKKSPEDIHKLIPDENAETVKLMFRMALEGVRCFDIAQHLKKKHIPTPRAASDRLVRNKSVDAAKRPCDWSKNSVYQILTNPIYTGKLVMCRTKVKSFKNKKLVPTSPDEWITVENTHEALVSEEDYETVQQRISIRQPKAALNADNIFRGLLKCGECGTNMVWCKSKNRVSIGYYSCNLYKRYGGNECTYHYVTIEQLKELVLKSIKTNAAFAAANEEKYIDYLLEVSAQSNNVSISACNKEIDKCNNRISELDRLLQKLYEDNVFGKITDERYSALSQSMESEQKQLKARLSELSTEVQSLSVKRSSCEKYTKLIKNYADITELTSELLHTLIEKIVVHEYVENGEKTKEISVFYRFVGKI